MCNHKNFTAQVNVYRMHEGVNIDEILKAGAVEEPEITSYTTDIKIQCADCGMPFQFLGLPMGVSPTFPTRSMDGLELRQPIKPSPFHSKDGK